MEQPVVEPVVELTRPPEPVPDVYQYVPTEPVILSPQPPIIRPDQEIDDLKKQLATLTAMIEKIPNKYKGI